MSETTSNLPPQTQHERWVKYGLNVALSIIIVIVLAGLCVYLAQVKPRRIDTTVQGVYSLKPQTLGIIENLKAPIKIVSLYSRQSKRDDIETTMQSVQDLLGEYHQSGKGISVDFIDPVAQPAKADALINEVTTKYGGEVKEYRDFIDEYKKQYEVLKKNIADEVKAIHAVPFDDVKAPDLARSLAGLIDTDDELDTIEQTKDNADRRLAQKPPDYKGAVDEVQQNMDDVSQLIKAIQQEAAKDKDDKGTPDVWKAYLTESAPRYDEMKKLADGLDDKAKKLGDLKLDTLRQSLQEHDPILVMGENDLRVLTYKQIWQTPSDAVRQYSNGGAVKPVFAGEQMITTAIYGLTQPKKVKIAFVRPGGAPLTEPGIPGFTSGGPFSIAAERLREYNFDVIEKDVSGMYAMQAQQQGQPPPPEPSDAELQDAIWVVIAAPMNQQQGPMGAMPSAIGPKLLEHLNFGGSAFILPFPMDDSAINPLKSWGIDLRTDAVAVHEISPQQPSGASDDPAQEMQRYPFAFLLRDYGDHAITRPLRSLDSMLYPLLPVKTHAEKDVTVTPILPIPGAPGAPASWGETNLESLQKYELPTFDPKQDIPPPLFAGAAAEKKNGGRVVVVASPTFLFEKPLAEVDPDLARKHHYVLRYPGNMELFTNSIFWLAHQESMISISPAALQVSRISDMSDATLTAWRIGLLLVGMPGAVILAGILMFFARRD